MSFKKKEMLFFNIFLFALLVLLGAVIAAGGCGRRLGPPPAQPPASEEEVTPQKSAEEGEPPAAQVVLLYFTSHSADKLIVEERKIPAGEEDLKVSVLKELVKGPRDPGLVPTIPGDVKVLGVTLEKGVATVDFSPEIRNSHWGGSSGEILTVYSVVNTMARLPGIEEVRFLINGEEIDTLLGHLDISEPLDPDWRLVETF